MNRFTFDTNVLIYPVDLRFPEKHAIAKRLVRLCGESGSGVPLQCLSEFYRATTRKHILPLSTAFDVVEETRNAMRVIPPASEDLLAAMQYHQVHKVPFFDGLLLSTVARAGYTTLFTEDFQTNRELGGVTFANPFLPGFDLEDFCATRCLVPAFDGAYFSQREKEALWARFYTGAPQRQRRSVERYNIVKRA